MSSVTPLVEQRVSWSPKVPLPMKSGKRNWDFHEGHMVSLFPARNLTKLGRTLKVQPVFHLLLSKIKFKCSRQMIGEPVILCKMYSCSTGLLQILTPTNYFFLSGQHFLTVINGHFFMILKEVS